MAATSAQVSNGATSLSDVFESASHLQIVEFLVRVDEPRRQKTIADGVGISQPTVSRSKQSLLEAGVIEELDQGLSITDEYGEHFYNLITELEE